MQPEWNGGNPSVIWNVAVNGLHRAEKTLITGDTYEKECQNYF